MVTRRIFRWFLFSSLAGVTIMLWFMIIPVRASCGDPQSSSCITCHTKEDPVNGKGEWHIIHASKDICINCHGGNGTSMVKDLAHEDLTANPLNDIYTDCHSCHPLDYVGRASIFAPTLGVTPGSCATPTLLPVVNTYAGPMSGNINISTKLISSSFSWQSFLVVVAMMSIVLLFVFGLVWMDRHHI